MPTGQIPRGGCTSQNTLSPQRQRFPSAWRFRESEGEFVEWTESMPALCIYHHGAYEEMYDVVQKLLEYAKENGLEPRGMVRNTYLEGPPQHKDPHKFITQVALPLK